MNAQKRQSGAGVVCGVLGMTCACRTRRVVVFCVESRESESRTERAKNDGGEGAECRRSASFRLEGD
jgi:hypothetical protein